MKKKMKRFKKSLVKDIKISLKKNKKKSDNMAVKDIRISHKMKNKLRIAAKSLNKVLVSSCYIFNITILGWPRFQFLAIRVGENAAILGQPTFSNKEISDQVRFP